MANIKKNFNFRNGVQVDDDNLLVTATGLVGIGTTIPTEALDVRGNVKVIGDANITQATVGLLTITEVAPVKIIGAGLSVVSGIVTAEGTGILTYFGDAEIQITSETGISGITFGRETGNNNTNNGELRYGGGAGFSLIAKLLVLNFSTVAMPATLKLLRVDIPTVVFVFPARTPTTLPITVP